jgi:polar amino acid transport system substrate-binding protein
MKRTKLTKLLALMLMICVAFTFAACGQKAVNAPDKAQGSTSVAKAETKLDQIKKAGKIVVGTSADYPPYEFKKAVNGKDEIVGFDIEIAKEIAKDLGVKLEIQDMKFEGLLPALATGNIDFVIAGMTPDEERKKSVDFTKIYYTASQGVMVRAEDKDKIKTIADLKGKKVGAQKSAIQEKIAKEQIADATLISLGKIPDLIMELKNKKVDALVVELPVASGYVANNKDLAISDVKVKDDTGGSAIAVKKGNKELVDAMDATLDRLLKDKLIDKYVADANVAVEGN